VILGTWSQAARPQPTSCPTTSGSSRRHCLPGRHAGPATPGLLRQCGRRRAGARARRVGDRVRARRRRAGTTPPPAGSCRRVEQSTVDGSGG
jgi:hypothetical protein